MVVGLPQGVYGIDYLNKALKKVNTKVDFKKLSHSISPYTGDCQEVCVNNLSR